MTTIRHSMTLPYIFARVSAMRSKLIHKSEYLKLVKMDLNAITRYLQESEYKDAITKMSSKYTGIELLDQALILNQKQVFRKLWRISPTEIEKLIESYLGRVDIHNLKVIIRGLYSNANKEDVLALVQPVGKYDEKHYEELFDMNRIEKVLKETKIIDFRQLGDAYEDFQKTNRLIELENAFTIQYYKKAIEFSKDLPGKGRLYTDFLKREIDMINIKNLLRLKKENIETKRIIMHMIPSGRKLNKNKLKNLAAAESMSSLMNQFQKLYYAKYVDFDEKRSLIDLQLSIDKYLMKTAFLRIHQNPLSITCVLGYMMSKIVELKNIRSIVKAKHLGIESDYVEQNLLI